MPKKGKKGKKKKAVAEPTRLKYLAFASVGGVCRAPLCAAVLRNLVKHTPIDPDIGIIVDVLSLTSIHAAELPLPVAETCAQKHGCKEFMTIAPTKYITKSDYTSNNHIIVMDEYNYIFK